MYFDKSSVVQYLSVHDEQLLKEIIIHNEKHRAICGATDA